MKTGVRMLTLSLIGNPVKIGDGPAAVTLPFSKLIWEETFEFCKELGKRNPFGPNVPLFKYKWVW
jgi:hypothetical protein